MKLTLEMTHDGSDVQHAYSVEDTSIEADGIEDILTLTFNLFEAVLRQAGWQEGDIDEMFCVFADAVAEKKGRVVVDGE